MDVVHLRVAEGLRQFLPARSRAADVQVRHDGTSTVGHLVESMGVPLTEVGTLRSYATTVPPEHRPRLGAVIEVSPIDRPQALPDNARGFVLDVHLGTLARRLRLVGLDTAYRNDSEDDELVRQTNAEHRILLTRDRRLLMRRAVWCAAYVYGDRPADQFSDVLSRFALELTPWSRCPACNGVLTTVHKDEIAHVLKPGTRRTYTAFSRCRSCTKVYWRGAHAQHLDTIVAAATERQRD